MQAPKNGFFYVLDRATGEFLDANPYTYVNWASGIGEDGRPIEVPGARYDDGQRDGSRPDRTVRITGSRRLTTPIRDWFTFPPS